VATFVLIFPAPKIVNHALTDSTVSSAANATNESGGEAEPHGREAWLWDGRERCKFAERERASHSEVADSIPVYQSPDEATRCSRLLNEGFGEGPPHNELTLEAKIGRFLRMATVETDAHRAAHSGR
jgi:hypothetical protein